MDRAGRLPGGWMLVVVALMLLPSPAAALSITSFRAEVDPVPPGGVLRYNIRVNPLSSTGEVGVFCFNPPPECITGSSTCSASAPVCSGNSFTGYVCEGSLNDGENCGVGDPPSPDVSLCVPNPSGVCLGGSNAGLPCTSSANCPGNTFVCQHAYNNNAFCGTGNPPQADVTLCIPNPTGICNGGPNFGLTCNAPHGVPTEECPPDEGSGTVSTDTSVTLPIPPETVFATANLGGTSDGSTITWELPAEPCSGPDGQSGAPPCPLLTADLTVNASTPEGTVIQNEVTATDPAGLVVVRTTKTNIGTFRLLKFRMLYPRRDGRDRMNYRGFFTLPPGVSISPNDEIFGIEIATTGGQQLMNLQLAPGQLGKVNDRRWRYSSRSSGLNRVLLNELGPSHYRINLSANKMNNPQPNDLTLIVRLTFGTHVLSQDLSLLVLRDGKKFLGVD